jgi:hypothetical protein
LATTAARALTLSFNLLHEVNDEGNELVLLHQLEVEVGDEEGDVVTLNRLATKNDEIVSTESEGASELVNENRLKGVVLLDSDRNSDRVDRRLNKALLSSVTSDDNGVQDKLLGHVSLDFRLVVTLNDLRREVTQTKCCLEGGLNSADIVLERISLWKSKGKRRHKKHVSV